MSARRQSDLVAASGLAIGGVFGLTGTMVKDASLRQVLWGIDGVALIVATSLLALKYSRMGNDLVAAGFLVFAIGESLLVGGTAGGLEAGTPAFGGGVALWAAALLLTSIPREFASWVRIVGLIGAVLFLVVAARIFWGEPLTAISTPLPFFAYPFLVLTFIGWISAIIREGA